MKVLFMFGGLPHYYNKILNRLNKIENLEISVLIPLSKSNVIGKGVHQTKSGIDFQLFSLSEYKTYFGKTFFKDFSKLINENNFDAIVTTWPYILGFVFYPNLRKLIRNKGIIILYKDIPFQVPEFKEGLKLKVNEVWDESSIKISLTFFQKISLLITTLLRKYMYSIVDAHLNYIEEAYKILGSYGVKKDKIFITYNSPDTDSLFEARDEAKRLGPIIPYSSQRIIHVGRLVKWKRTDLLLSAVSLLKDKFNDIELVIIGTGPEEVNLKKIAADLKISDRINFAGGIYDPITLGRYMEASSVYVLAGMGGLSINEAMAFGKPVICSVCDGTEKSLLRDDFNGKYFKEGDLTDIVKKIEMVLSDKEKISKMGENSFQIIKNEININTVINGYIKAFNYISNNKHRLLYTP